MEALDVLANNLANAGTPGFKADREFYSTYVSAEAALGTGTDPVLPVVQRNWTDFSQGALTPTTNPFDIAVNGAGFLKVAGPSGPLYIRSGTLQISKAGELATAEGYTVPGTDGKPIHLDASLPMEIAPDGTVRQDGQTVGQIALLDFGDKSAIRKRGNNYFQIDRADLQPQSAAGSFAQGKLEAANFETAESAVRRVSVLRQFETLQRAVRVGSEMDKQLIEDVAKPA